MKIKKEIVPAAPAVPAVPAEPESAVSPDITPAPEQPATVSLFDVTGSISPTDATEGAVMPEGDAPAEKRGRGRPKGTGKKPASKATESELVALSVANAEMVVGALDLLRAAVSGGECAANPTIRTAAVSAWAAYLEEQGLSLPPWVQVSIISIMYVAPAFATNSGKEKVSTVWGKIKAAYRLWRA